MNQLFIVLAMLFIGDFISKIFHLPIPSNVLGFALLFAALCGKIIKLHQVERISDFIINNLALFFVVPIVGVMVHRELIRDKFFYIFVPLAISVIAGFFVAAKVTELIIKRAEKKSLNFERYESGDENDE